jgi:LuxR family transcriptional regulator, maltose regulon positive regulatory protein
MSVLVWFVSHWVIRMPISILATKLFLPQTQHKLVPRPQLIERLDAALTYPVTVISAPAGSGKTSVLRAWVARHQATVAWLSLDPEDNDPTRFWTYVIAALQRLQPGLAKNTHAVLQAQEQPPHFFESVLTMLLNELVAVPDTRPSQATNAEQASFQAGIALVLDDYHVIDNPAIHTGIAFLIDHLPTHLHVLIASRSDPPLPLARRRASQQVCEIRFEDLRFTAEEVALFLNQVMALQLTTDHVAALAARTEGWIAGLQLAALALQGRDAEAQRQFVAAFSGSQRYILDYLVEEVFNRQPEHTQQFLLRTSVLDYMLGALCNTLTGHNDGQAMLEALERANLFVVPMDEERRWYRYHQLFAEVLRLRLQRTEPDLVPVLHRTAASWYQANDLIDDAMHHALEAGDSAWIADLIEQYLEATLHRGEGETLRRWLAAVPAEVVRTRPRLILAQALVALNVGQLDQAETLLDAIAHIAPSEPYTPSIGIQASMLANVPAARELLRASLFGLRGDADQSIESLQRAVRLVNQDERGPRVSVRWNTALADWMRGRLAEAEQAYRGLYAEAKAAGQPHAALGANALLARVQRTRGGLGHALHTYQDGLAFAARAGASAPPTVAMAYVGMAEVFYHRNQLDQALRHASAAVPLGQQLVSMLTAATGLATLAWTRQALGDPSAARAAIEEAYRLIPADQVAALHNPVPAERARLVLAQGDLQAALDWVTTRRLHDADALSYPHEREYLVLARVLLAQHAPARALRLLERLAAKAQAQARRESVIEAGALAAVALAALGKRAPAHAKLSEALTMARPEGYIRIFADEGAPMAALLRQVNGELRPFALQVLAAIEGTAAALWQKPAAALVESLTERELDVLRALATGQSNRAIAQQLYLSIATVKVHLKHIYGKLVVTSRTEALVRAHELNLL